MPPFIGEEPELVKLWGPLPRPHSGNGSQVTLRFAKEKEWYLGLIRTF